VTCNVQGYVANEQRLSAWATGREQPPQPQATCACIEHGIGEGWHHCSEQRCAATSNTILLWSAIARCLLASAQTQCTTVLKRMSWARLVPRCQRVYFHPGNFISTYVPRSCVRSVGTHAVATEERTKLEYPQVPFRAAIDFKFIAENVDMLKANAINRNSNADPEKVAELYSQFVAMSRETDALRKQRNDNAKAMKVRTEPTPKHICYSLRFHTCRQ
jgi:hypothetical protein